MEQHPRDKSGVFRADAQDPQGRQASAAHSEAYPDSPPLCLSSPSSYWDFLGPPPGVVSSGCCNKL